MKIFIICGSNRVILFSISPFWSCLFLSLTHLSLKNYSLLKPERKCSTGIDFVFFNETEEERLVNKILRLQPFEEKKSYC